MLVLFLLEILRSKPKTHRSSCQVVPRRSREQPRARTQFSSCAGMLTKAKVGCEGRDHRWNDSSFIIYRAAYGRLGACARRFIMWNDDGHCSQSRSRPQLAANFQIFKFICGVRSPLFRDCNDGACQHCYNLQ